MIVDLMRNDVGRVAEVGSVDVPALFTVERYETVLQLTSDVTARLRPGTGLVELFRALFPCGSVTGAPKASSMEIIRSLEPDPRGVYCGAIGLVGPPDAPVRARFSVAIRTVVVDTTSGEAVYGTGSGITWGSEAAAEHAEVLAKAAVLSARPRDFELLETMRHDPERGLRNRDRHLERLAASAEHLGFRFDPPAARRLLDARLAGSRRHASGSGCAATGPSPSTSRRYRRPRPARCCSRSTTSRSTPRPGGCTTRRACGSPTTGDATGGPTSRTWSCSTPAGS
jgi:para-aminobenzoate synthetase / 4-amino-4-deoxychorismate lyase